MIHFIILSSVLFSALPTFINYPPIRSGSDLGPVVTDIEGHLLSGHPYRDADKITWVHEGTHGINNRLRNEFMRPGFYVLENRAILLKEELRTTLTRVSRLVPVSLRGDVYNLYFIEMSQWWENQPSYIFDEWVAYTNGAEARQKNAVNSRKGTVRYMIEFCIYSTCVAQSPKSTDPQVRAFIMWQIKRSMILLRKSRIKSAYLNRLRRSADATELHVYMRDYFGLEFTRKVLGF